jgi:HPt (histidine-containing phosphotransfer) domain-containing protein
MGTETLDYEKALAELGHDTEIYAEVVTMFLQDTPDILAKMLQALSAGDVATLGRLAHSLKSSARTVGGMRLGAQAQKLEQQCAEGLPAVEREILAVLSSEYSSLKEELAERGFAAA